MSVQAVRFGSGVPISSAAPTPPLHLQQLYQAQAKAKEVFKTSFFPCYSADYVQSQQGIKKAALWCYSKLYDGISCIYGGLHATASCVGRVFRQVLGLFNPLWDLVYPINPINGERHFPLIPRSLEKLLGDWFFYPLALNGNGESYECLAGSDVSIAEINENCLKRLTAANEQIVNPPGRTAFTYRIRTVPSIIKNAFAVPAGGLVVFSQLIKEIDGAIRSNRIKNATISFADNSKVTVDLSDITRDDVIAALLAHEMTHVAARHSIVTLVSFAFMTALLTLIRLVLFPFFLLAPSDFVSWLIMRIRELSFLFNSRKHELECDVTANFFTQNAGYNPLGAFVLQEIIRERGSLKDFMHKNFEFVFTHPHQDKRMRAIFASIQQLQPQALHGRLKWEIADNGYDFLRTAPGVSYAHRAQEAVPS